MQQGLAAGEVAALRKLLKVDRRTSRRWSKWWVTDFVDTAFWKDARARFSPPVSYSTLPLSLCNWFAIDLVNPNPESLTTLMKFLRPLYDP